MKRCNTAGGGVATAAAAAAGAVAADAWRCAHVFTKGKETNDKGESKRGIDK
jgi:hypothetical protein